MNLQAAADAIQRRAAIMSRVQRTGGASTKELCAEFNLGTEAVCQHIAKLRGTGEAFTSRVSFGVSGGWVIRHFGTEAEAEAWAEKEKRTPRKRKPVAGADLVVRGGTVSHPPPKMPKPAAQPIETASTKYTRDTAERANAAWQVLQLKPDPRWPSFSATRPGQNPETGRAW